MKNKRQMLGLAAALAVVGCASVPPEPKVREPAEAAPAAVGAPAAKPVEAAPYAVPPLGGVGPSIAWCGGDAPGKVRMSRVEASADKAEVALKDDEGFIGLDLPGEKVGWTIVVDYAALPAEGDGRMQTLGSFNLDRNVNRVMAVVDGRSGDVFAVAQNDANRWKGEGTLVRDEGPGMLAFSYDYERGLAVWQRVGKGDWTLLVSSVRCRYRNERPSAFSVGCLDRRAEAAVPDFRSLAACPVRGIYAYPKVLLREELAALPARD